MVKSCRDLKVWQTGMEVSQAVYKATERFPKSELFGLVSQMRRAAVSIPANIAEGFSRQHKSEFVQFAYIAKGSLSELDTLVDLADRLGYLGSENTVALSGRLDELGKMLHGFIASLRKPVEAH